MDDTMKVPWAPIGRRGWVSVCGRGGGEVGGSGALLYTQPVSSPPCVPVAPPGPELCAPLPSHLCPRSVSGSSLRSGAPGPGYTPPAPRTHLQCSYPGTECDVPAAAPSPSSSCPPPPCTRLTALCTLLGGVTPRQTGGGERAQH